MTSNLPPLHDFWKTPIVELLQTLDTTSQGLTSEEAHKRLLTYGPNLPRPQKKSEGLSLFLSQFKSPIILILLFAAALSLFLEGPTDALIIFVIIFVSSILGFWQEHRASNAVKNLLAIVKITSAVIRDDAQKDISSEEIVPGDIVLLSAGTNIPADSIILESKDLFVNESVLTGETFPVEKTAGTISQDMSLGKRTNSLFTGTNVVSGNAKAVVVKTGSQTEFGKVSEQLRLRMPETEFERGVRRFGYFLMQVTLTLVIAIFAINVYFARPILESFLFALALAVGLTPQLLPAIISVNLSHGARRMANHKVVVKRLASIENFGSMNILCSDKTGTLTEGTVHIKSSLDANGNESQKVSLYAYLNAFFETGYRNPIDEAIRAYKQFDVTSYKKLDETPYDFIRKRLTILVSKDENHFMITKGALLNILSVCTFAETSIGIVELNQVREKILQKFEDLGQKGFRTLGISYKNLDNSTLKREDETNMVFLGFLILFDPPKQGINDTIKALKNLGVTLKIITGDNKLVAITLSQQIGFSNPRFLTGPELRQTSDDALYQQVNKIDVFSDVEPDQKERIRMALKKAGNVVGHIGDGITDAPALHTADVGISVDSAVDVAKEAADIVLLEKDLGVLVSGVEEGRRTFANTLKYVFMATSANFGNMFSMAGASTFLPFLPGLPKQILLTNLMTDFPEMTISTDNVDKEAVNKPRRFDNKFIRKFMIIFGILNSVSDFTTFGILLGLGVTVEQFRTGWFIENVVSACFVVLAVRTRKPLIKSNPSRYLLFTTLVIACVVPVVPYTPLGKEFGFVPLPISVIAILGMIIIVYIIGVEATKRIFYKRIRY